MGTVDLFTGIGELKGLHSAMLGWDSNFGSRVAGYLVCERRVHSFKGSIFVQASGRSKLRSRHPDFVYKHWHQETTVDLQNVMLRGTLALS